MCRNAFTDGVRPTGPRYRVYSALSGPLAGPRRPLLRSSEEGKGWGGEMKGNSKGDGKVEGMG